MPYGTGTRFLTSVQFLFRLPTARVWLGAGVSEACNVKMDTRQGCPMLPLLFAMAMEPLAIYLRNKLQDLSIPVGDNNHVVSMYAGDMLIYVREPEHSVPLLMQLLEHFGKISGLCIN